MLTPQILKSTFIYLLKLVNFRLTGCKCKLWPDQCKISDQSAGLITCTECGSSFHRICVKNAYGAVPLGTDGCTSISSVISVHNEAIVQELNGFVETLRPYGRDLQHDGTKERISPSKWRVVGDIGNTEWLPDCLMNLYFSILVAWANMFICGGSKRYMCVSNRVTQILLSSSDAFERLLTGRTMNLLRNVGQQ